MARHNVGKAISRFFRKHRDRRYIYRRCLTRDYYFSLETTRLLSSRGIIENCDIHADIPMSSMVDENYVRSIPERCALLPVDNNPISIYLCTDSIALFIQTVLVEVRRPFILVTGDSDLPVNHVVIAKIEELLSNPLLLKWFAQNLEYRHPKAEPMPIGLDFHSAWQDPVHYGSQHILPAFQEGELRKICRAAKKNSQRKPLVMCDWIGRSAYGDREEARHGISEAARIVPSRRLPRHQLWQEYVKYAFVASPFGIGLDCHRTWEAIALGCIPIVKKSVLNPLFEGMPVLVVETWDQITLEYLQQQQEEFASQNFDYSKIFLSYWWSRINKGMQAQSLVSTVDDVCSLV